MYQTRSTIALLIALVATLIGCEPPAHPHRSASVPAPKEVVTGFVCPPCNAPCDTLVFSEAGMCPHCHMKLEPAANVRKVAIFLYDGVEILDFSGPTEVFSFAGNDKGHFKVFTVALDRKPIVSQGCVTVTPQYSLDECPIPDIVVFPGGSPQPSLDNARITQWLKTHAPNIEVVMSVCTGAFFLAAAGLLDGLKATTFHSQIDALREAAPKAEVLEKVRWVDNGHIVTTAGISAGIDGSLHLVERLLGADAALEVATRMEYEAWNPKNGMVIEPAQR